MNPELEALILAYEKVSASKDREAEQCLLAFESRLDRVMERQPSLSRDILRKSIIKEHHQSASQVGFETGWQTAGNSPESLRRIPEWKPEPPL
jgi:hypothetical protein